MPALTSQDRQALSRLVDVAVADAITEVVAAWKPSRAISAREWRNDAEHLDTLATDLQKLLTDSLLVRGGYLGNAWAINKRGNPTTNDWGGLGEPVPAAVDLVARLDELRALCRNAAHVIDDPKKAGGEFSKRTREPADAAKLGNNILTTLKLHGVRVASTDNGTAAEVLRIVLPACGVSGDALNVIRGYCALMKRMAESVTDTA